MTALEIFAILVLAGAVIVLFYYYLKEMNEQVAQVLTH